MLGVSGSVKGVRGVLEAGRECMGWWCQQRCRASGGHWGLVGGVGGIEGRSGGCQDVEGVRGALGLVGSVRAERPAEV